MRRVFLGLVCLLLITIVLFSGCTQEIQKISNISTETEEPPIPEVASPEEEPSSPEQQSTNEEIPTIP